MKTLMALGAIAIGASSFGGIAGAATEATGDAGASVTHYAVSFPNVEIAPGVVQSYSCDGNRIVNGGVGTTDVETCHITGNLSTLVAGTYKSTEIAPASLGYCVGFAVGSVPFYFGGALSCWSSDFDGQLASSWKLTFAPTDGNPGSWTESIVAYYNG